MSTFFIAKLIIRYIVAIMKKDRLHRAVKRAIAVKGSQTALAAAVGVTQPTIFDWLNRMKMIPAERVPDVESATGIPRHELRPDLWQSAA